MGQRIPCWFILCVALLIGVFPLLAQTDPTDFRDPVERSWRSFLPTHTLGLIESPDLGVIEAVHRQPKPPWVVLSTEQRFFHVNNVFLSETDRESSLGWDGWFELELAPYSTYLWRPRIIVEHEMYRFERAAEADFDNQIVRAESSLALLPDRSVRWDISYAYWRFTEPHGEANEFLKMGEFRHRLLWTVPLRERPELWLIAFWDFEVRHASPSSADRLSQEVNVSLVWLPSSHIDVELFVEPGLRIYRHDPEAGRSRTDLHLDSGLRASWWPWRQIALSAELRWIGNNSDVEGGDYYVWEPSLSLYGSLQF